MPVTSKIKRTLYANRVARRSCFRNKQCLITVVVIIVVWAIILLIVLVLVVARKKLRSYSRKRKEQEMFREMSDDRGQEQLAVAPQAPAVYEASTSPHLEENKGYVYGGSGNTYTALPLQEDASYPSRNVL